MPVGNRVYLKRKMPDKEVMKEFKEIPASNIADTMGRSCALNPRIKLMSSPKEPIMVGPALTVKTRPGDNLLIHKAFNMAEEGDIIVISNEGDMSRALAGEVMISYVYYAKKIGGIIFDGPIRDIDTLSKLELPIYATGSTPGGPYKEGPGEVNVPISCGEISVNPGDIIVADADGIIVVPRQDAKSILEAAKAFKIADNAKLEAAKNGTSKREWVEKTLEAKGCEIIDGYYED